jgi:predicted phosphodiesterase
MLTKKPIPIRPPQQDELSKLLKQKHLTTAQLEAVIDQVKHPPQHSPIVRHEWGDKRVRIGLASDLHIGSKFQDQAALEDAFKRFKSEGVEAVYLAGDITEGYNMRPGHSYECSLHGADDQVKGVVDRVPRIGKPLYFILGDHDHSHYKNAGHDIGPSIADKRDDMTYLGLFSAKIALGKDAMIELSHPAKGTAYALSYQIQKMIESMEAGSKPNILAVGHYHKVEQLFYRNVHAFQTGTLQNQTGWMRRMNISAHKGAWLLDVYLHPKKGVDKIVSTLIPYYD